MSMEIEKLVQPALDWTGESWGGRVDHAASFLFIHGYITQAQRAKVTQKLDKQYQDGLASGRIIQKPHPEPAREEGSKP